MRERRSPPGFNFKGSGHPARSPFCFRSWYPPSLCLHFRPTEIRLPISACERGDAELMLLWTRGEGYCSDLLHPVRLVHERDGPYGMGLLVSKLLNPLDPFRFRLDMAALVRCSARHLPGPGNCRVDGSAISAPLQGACGVEPYFLVLRISSSLSCSCAGADNIHNSKDLISQFHALAYIVQSRTREFRCE